ncbi:HNH endonuclease family protein [Yinghuangia seranimata]|uniref:HNH endonuclease family protein n=1 Tax=Yinghuangia seranimata TaxID=408067 RepID=UPI00248A9217|nr:HNH endonuclease family protein [Yinghuangia seranimata]MDI2132619.1 HNH endonuclease family protein [Yinghuangia seranimata]
MSRGWGRGRRIAAAALLVTAALTASGCKNDGDKVSPGGAAAPVAPGAARPGAVPLTNTDGTAPGLGPVTADADRTAARAVIDKVRTAGRGAKTGYDRDQYGPAWTDKAAGVPMSGNGCGTRDDILKRDGTGVQFKSGSTCVVNTMTLADPYTGKTIAFTKSKASTVQIDHVVALSASWQMGAARWPADKRQQLANDPLNLIAVDGPTNNAKGDGSPATWLPPNKDIRCAYVVRYAQVSLKYDLPVTDADKVAMQQQCA